MVMLRPAEEMKDSGIEWVGSVPQDWKVVPIGSCFDEVVKKNKEGLVKNALKFTYGQIVPKTNFDADEDDYVADTILNYYIVDPGTIMINGLNLNFDLISQRTGLVKERGIITSAYVGIIPKDFSVTLPDFMNYLFKAYDYRMAFHNMGGGVRKILNFTRLKSQKVCFPTITEQQAIADYLEDRCSKLDEIIAEAEKSIEEYKELKQAVIFEAVTKGLDKNVPMRDSGYSCIGKIPQNWVVGKLKNIVDISDGTHDTPAYVNFDKSFPLVTPKCIVNGNIDVSVAGRISEEDYIEINKRSYVEKYDVLMTMIGSTVGNCAVVVDDPEYAIKNIALLRTKGSYYLGKYVFYLFNCNVFRFQYEMNGHSTAQAFISQSMLKNLVIPIPTYMNSIVIYLDKEIGKIDTLMQEKHEVIEALQNYKKALIYEVVTGKKRVVI